MSINPNKVDPQLGQRIHQHLMNMDVESPFNMEISYGDRDHKIKLIENHFHQIIQILGLDIANDQLSRTPSRLAAHFVDDAFAGMDINTFPKITTYPNASQSDVIVIRNIPVSTTCECHWLPIVGTATVAFVPSENTMDSSKVAKIVEYFAKRPQSQDRLTSQIYHSIQHILQTSDVAVSISAKQISSTNNGIDTITNKFGGVFSYNQSISASDFMATVIK